MVSSTAYLMLTHASHIPIIGWQCQNVGTEEEGKNFFTDGRGRFRRFGESRQGFLRGSTTKVKEAFIHAWSGYRNYAMGYDELMPLSHRGVDGLGGLGATIVDALDTAMIMGVDEVVHEAGSWIEKHLPERIDGKGQGGNASTRGPKPAVYLDNARNLADRLLIAFTSSPSAIPFSDVVLRDRSASSWLPDGLSSTAEVSTSNLSSIQFFDCPQTGEFSGDNIRLGSRGDSYYEYLIKVWLQNGGSNLTYLYNMYEESMKGVKELLVRKSVPNGLVFVGELPYGPEGAFSPKMDHLVCFLPGTLALGATKGIVKEKAMRENLLNFEDLQNLKLAEDLAKTCFEMYSVTSTGLAPEIAYFKVEGQSEGGPGGGNKNSKYVDDIIIKPADRHNLLRPETVESLFVLFRITEDPKYREWGWEIFEAFEKYTKVDSGGYTSLDDVTVLPPHRRDKMETFFLGETLKYLYLLFGDRNALPLDKYVFNTEAHPLPIRGNAGTK
ncbi:UNVERIFIED_CONTAM: Mannosyl-oligosaccharide 1,2-alpha-mannosidase MNS3 [Sesamum angustifolium]|uniref:alpha-1,2-Mannosidase n=1 Tax=Sesamum angustifolium TaxID=2727405 RepID=A0AAW2PAJ0_9LAMI